MKAIISGKNYANADQSFTKIRKKILNSWYGANITLIIKPDKDIVWQLETDILHEHRCKTPFKKLANPIQKYIKWTMHHDQRGLSKKSTFSSYFKKINQCNSLYQKILINTFSPGISIHFNFNLLCNYAYSYL